MDKFILTIEMGNDAMTTLEDVAAALLSVANKLDNGRSGGKIMDANGNVVGTFEFVDTSDDSDED